MIGLTEVRQSVIRAQTVLNLPGQFRQNLAIGTAAHESMGFKFRMQQGGGPAMGLWQIEPNTHKDLYANYLNARPSVRTRLISLLDEPEADKLGQLITNDAYAAGVCLLIYYRSPAKTSDVDCDPNDVSLLAKIWKQHYNTPLGKGTERKFMDDYLRYVLNGAS
jgi:hypothetical protein